MRLGFLRQAMTVQLLLQSLVNGVGLSMVYILVALGLTLIFSILRIINFAHGEFYMMGGFISYYCTQYLQTNYLLTIIIAWPMPTSIICVTQAKASARQNIVSSNRRSASSRSFGVVFHNSPQPFQ